MPDSKTELIRALFAAYLSNDREAVENAFGDDFRFTSPYDDAIDKATYFERCWKLSDWIERQQLERIFVQGDEAFVTYRCTAKDGKSFRNTEFFRFEGDRISSIDVYFGATYREGVFRQAAGVGRLVPVLILRARRSAAKTGVSKDGIRRSAGWFETHVGSAKALPTCSSP